MSDPVSLRRFLEDDGAREWRVMSEGACAFYHTRSVAQSAAFVQAIAELAGGDDHTPDIDIRPGGVTVRLNTIRDDHYGPTERDLDMARRISVVARELGLKADSDAIQSLLVIVGSPVPSEVIPFWEALLGYERRPDNPDEDLVDPRGRGPAVWFEPMDEPHPDGGGAIHVGVWVPPDLAEERVAAVLAAGGRLVREIHIEPAPGFAYGWRTLVDRAGNEADISSPDRPD